MMNGDGLQCILGGVDGRCIEETVKHHVCSVFAGVSAEGRGEVVGKEASSCIPCKGT